MEKRILFLDNKIRIVWDNKNKKWLFSVVDIIAALTGTSNPKRYWSDLKRTIKTSGRVNALNKVTQLKLTAADGKKRLTDIAADAVILRIIKMIPSPNAKPLNEWLKTSGRGVTLLPEPLKSLTEPKPVNRILRVRKAGESFIILKAIDEMLNEALEDSTVINAADNEIKCKNAAAQSVFFSAAFVFPWHVRLNVNEPVTVNAGLTTKRGFG